MFPLDQRLLAATGQYSSVVVDSIAPMRHGEFGLALVDALGTQYGGVDVLCKHVERPYFEPVVSIISKYQHFTDRSRKRKSR
jgi:hypothetical protein